MKLKDLLFHLRDIFLLPGSVLVLVPCLIFDPSSHFMPEFWLIKIFSFSLFSVGFVVFAWTIFLFQQIGKGTLAPWSLKQNLVTKGPYQYIRNPMITAVLAMLISEGLWLRSLSILIWALIFFVINSLIFILIEEPYLDIKFGSEYQRYKATVARWLPRVHFKP